MYTTEIMKRNTTPVLKIRIAAHSVSKKMVVKVDSSAQLYYKMMELFRRCIDAFA